MHMKHLIILFLLLSSFSFAQDLTVLKATKQTINSGASPTSTSNYLVEIKKTKKCKLSIDSIINVYTQKLVPFNTVKVDNADFVSPNYQPVKASAIKEKGVYQLTFASMKNRGSGRPGTPMNLVVPVAEFSQGAVIHYTIGKKKKQLLIESFEQLETINAP